MSIEFIIDSRYHLRRKNDKPEIRNFKRSEKTERTRKSQYEFAPSRQHEVNQAFKAIDQILNLGQEESIKPPVKHKWQPRRKAGFGPGGAPKHAVQGYRMIMPPTPSFADIVEARINAEFKKRIA